MSPAGIDPLGPPDLTSGGKATAAALLLATAAHESESTTRQREWRRCAAWWVGQQRMPHPANGAARLDSESESPSAACRGPRAATATGTRRERGAAVSSRTSRTPLVPLELLLRDSASSTNLGTTPRTTRLRVHTIPPPTQHERGHARGRT